MEKKTFTEMWNNTTTFTKVTSILCVISIVSIFFAFFMGGSFAKVGATKEILNRNKEMLAEEKESLKTHESSLKEQQELLPDAQATYDKALSEFTNAAKALDAVCTRSYYSSYRCTPACKPLHDAESNMKSARNTAEDELDDINDEIVSLNNRIENTKNNIEEYKSYVSASRKKHSSAVSGALFTFIGVLLSMGSIGALVLYLLNKENKKIGLLSAIAMLVAAGCHLLCHGALGILPLLLSAGIGLMLLLIFRGTTENPAKLRNAAVVFAAFLMVTSVLLGVAGIFSGIFYGAIMICALFAVVPLNFTEYISIAKHLFLSVITFGIWNLVWIYFVTRNLNKVAKAEKRSPAAELALCLFLPLYYAYWLYKTAEGTELYGLEKSKECKLESLVILFAFVNSLFATVLIQSKINWIAGKEA